MINRLVVTYIDGPFDGTVSLDAPFAHSEDNAERQTRSLLAFYDAAKEEGRSIVGWRVTSGLFSTRASEGDFLTLTV
jgi:hypothetical protein